MMLAPCPTLYLIPGQNVPAKVAQKIPHKLCKISTRSAQHFGDHFKITPGVCITPPPCMGVSYDLAILNLSDMTNSSKYFRFAQGSQHACGFASITMHWTD